jgi:hypothetical protein
MSKGFGFVEFQLTMGYCIEIDDWCYNEHGSPDVRRSEAMKDARERAKQKSQRTLSSNSRHAERRLCRRPSRHTKSNQGSVHGPI